MQVCRRGELEFVTVQGSAGLGKTRLVSVPLAI